MLLKKSNKLFKLVDTFYIVMMALPILAGIILQVLTEPKTDGINITGARIFFTIPMPVQDFPVTESQINCLIVTLFILGMNTWMKVLHIILHMILKKTLHLAKNLILYIPLHVFIC